MQPRKQHRLLNRQYRHRQARCPPLRLTPYAWAKLLTLRDLGPTEVGAFGLSRPGDLLLVEDVRLVLQACTAVTVRFNDESVADFFDDQVDSERTPETFARIWIHTHPGPSPNPSATDEETFARCFGSADWAVMFILARGGDTYARLRYCQGPGGEYVLPVKIDFTHGFPGSDEPAWADEYRQNVFVESPTPRYASQFDGWADLPSWGDADGSGKSFQVRKSPLVLADWGEFCDA